MKTSRLLYARVHPFVKQLQHLWTAFFWTVPDNLWALKVTLAIALMIIPFSLFSDPFIGCTLALGSVGAALAEGDDHPRGRWYSFIITIISFVIMSLSVELLHNYPWIYGPTMAVTAFFLILLGGLSSRYQGITFGALLVGVYAMLGLGFRPWYYQPIFLPLGGVMYGSISLILLSFRPYRLLKEQLTSGYSNLGDYLALKASLFPCTKREYKKMQPRLVSKNIAVGEGVDKFKSVLYNFLGVLEGKPLDGVAPYYRQWIILQQLHERATSTHQRYDILTKDCKNELLLEGFGQYMKVLARTIKRFGANILTDKKFVLPTSLHWTHDMVKLQLEQSKDNPEYTSLSLLYDNLEHIRGLLISLQEVSTGYTIPLEELQYKPAPLKQRLKALFKADNLRFRHAIRLSLCMLVGYILMEAFHLEKGVWIVLTAVFVCQRDYVSTRRRLPERILGTFIGVLLGAVFAKLMPSVEGQILVTLGSIFTFFYWVRKRYTIAVIFISTFVIGSFNLQGGYQISLVGYRILYTLIGSLLSYLSVRFLWPDWQYRHIPQYLDDAISKTGRYFYTIYGTKVKGTVYYHNRRTAHYADNALAMAWQGMGVEPKKKRLLQQKAYALTNLHHALLSYVSALGAHYYGKLLSSEEIKICEHITTILEQVGVNLDPTIHPSAVKISIDEASAWNLQLKEQLKHNHNQNMTILYNISLTATELLKESADTDFKKDKE